MNGKDIFLGLKYVGEDLIEEAEYGAFPSRTEKTTSKKKGGLRRPLLIAAIVALMLMLVGCAVVYVLKMQDMKVGDTTETQPVFATDGINIIGYQDVSYEVLTLAGLKGTPGYQAALDWFEFRQEYDPDHSIIVKLQSEGNIPEFPMEYSAYNLYTQEMKDQLDAIMETYHLKPMGAALDFRTLKNMCAALNIERIHTGENGVIVSVDSGECRESGNFSLSLDFTLPKSAESEMDTTWGMLRWNRKDCFSEDLFTIEQSGDWTEWNYTTTSGNEVLIMRSPSDWRGWIICSREEAVMSLQVEARKDLWNNRDGKTWADEVFLTDRQMELIADAIDFSIQPRVATQEDVANQPAPPNAATQNGYTVSLKSVETDGWIARITMSITAPEGVIISRNPQAGFEDEFYTICPTNHDSVTPAQGRDVAGSGAWNSQEDGDGLDNTQDIVLVKTVRMEDGSAPFASGRIWNIRFEDLEAHYWDSTRSTTVRNLLAEGEWNFEINFDEKNGDYREIELLSAPITAKACTAWKADGTDILEELEVTSIKLRSFSIDLTCENKSADFFSFTGVSSYIVMKDGSRVAFFSNELTEPIDLDQVDYVLLADGTKLEMPA